LKADTVCAEFALYVHSAVMLLSLDLNYIILRLSAHLVNEIFILNLVSSDCLCLHCLGRVCDLYRQCQHHEIIETEPRIV